VVRSLVLISPTFLEPRLVRLI